MSKDSWFRGALLSALFFGLVAGPLPAQSSRPSTAPEIGVPGTGGTVTPTSVAVSSSTNYYRAHAMARELKGMCDCLASVGFRIEVVAYAAMIVGVALALATVISGGGCWYHCSTGRRVTVCRWCRARWRVAGEVLVLQHVRALVRSQFRIGRRRQIVVTLCSLLGLCCCRAAGVRSRLFACRQQVGSRVGDPNRLPPPLETSDGDVRRSQTWISV